ncbi:MAG: hypothetical protein WBA76_12720 [Phormidesmis sp.]
MAAVCLETGVDSTPRLIRPVWFGSFDLEAGQPSAGASRLWVMALRRSPLASD